MVFKISLMVIGVMAIVFNKKIGLYMIEKKMTSLVNPLGSVTEFSVRTWVVGMGILILLISSYL